MSEKNELHYAVVVGVDRYPGLGNLGLPRNDATKFAEWLRDENGGNLPKDNVRLILREQDELFDTARRARPKGEEIEWDLAEIHKELEDAVEGDSELWARSRLYIYVSGHGVAPSGGLGAMVFADADPVLNLWDLIELDDIKGWYKKSGLFREVLLFADCCRERRPLAPGLRIRFGEPRRNYDQSNVFLIWGSEYGERAYEPTKDELDSTHGFFTRALLSGLEGGAADRQTGEISAVELAEYVTDAVKALTHHTRFPQTPDLDGNPLAISIRPPGLGVLPRVKRKVTLCFPEGYAGRVELLLGTAPIDEWDSGSGPWTVELDDGEFYCVRPLDGQPALERGGAFRAIAKDGDLPLSLEHDGDG